MKKFLENNTMNAKVNNWAVELESQNIRFEFIAGTKNVLADTLSRIIELDESIKLPDKEPGYKFGYTLTLSLRVSVSMLVTFPLM